MSTDLVVLDRRPRLSRARGDHTPKLLDLNIVLQLETPLLHFQRCLAPFAGHRHPQRCHAVGKGVPSTAAGQSESCKGITPYTIEQASRCGIPAGEARTAEYIAMSSRDFQISRHRHEEDRHRKGQSDAYFA